MHSTDRTVRTTTRSTALLGTGAAVAAALALAGCGSQSSSGEAASGSASPSASASSGGGAPATAVRTAWTTTSHTDSARLALDETVRAGGRTEAVHSTGVTALGGTGRPAGQFDVNAAGQRIQMRLLDRTLYEKLPSTAATRQLSDGKPWISVDTAKLAQSASMSTQAPDAGAQLAYLRDAEQVTRVGTETVDGVATTHYRMTVAPRALGAYGVHVAKSVPVDVWVDGKNRVVQERLSTAISGPSMSASPSGGPNESISLTMTMHLTDFGTPVHVTAPPAGQVTDATSRIARAAQGSGGGTGSAAG